MASWSRPSIKDHGECIAAKCPRCANAVVLHHVVLTQWITVVVPVVPHQRRRLLVCPVCHWSRRLGEDAVPLTEEMALITARWRAGKMTHADYDQRINAYWSLVPGGGVPAELPREAPIDPQL